MNQKTVNGGAGQATPEMREAWFNYFSRTVAEAPPIDWGGGTLQMLPGNQLALYECNGKQYTLDRASIDNPNTLQFMCAQYPGIAAEWERYGIFADTGMVAFLRGLQA